MDLDYHVATMRRLTASSTVCAIYLPQVPEEWNTCVGSDLKTKVQLRCY